MPYEWVDPDLFLTHAGVSVYHVYEDDRIDQPPYEYTFTTALYGVEFDDTCFSIWDLDIDHRDMSVEEIVREAIDRGLIVARN